MKALKTALIGSVLAVLLAGAGVIASSPSPRPVGATPLNAVALNSANCISLGIAFGGIDAVTAADACQAMGVQASLQKYVQCLRKQCGLTPLSPIQPQAKEFAPLDLDKNQVFATQDLLVFAFVDDDTSVRFTTDKGSMGGPIQTDPPTGKNYFCVAQDPDCDGNSATLGDGVVVGRVKITSGDGTGTGHVTAIQEGIGFPLTFTVTGMPDTITSSPLFGKDTIQTGATAPPAADSSDLPKPTDCTFVASVAGVLGANNDAEKAVIVVKALDNDGVETAGTLLHWNHPFVAKGADAPAPQGGVALPQTPMIDTGALGVGFPQFVCGGKETGDLKLKVNLDNSIDGALDTTTFINITIHVVGPAANMALVVDPAVVDCNGTNAAKVTASLTTAAGGPVADGLDVHFAVDVLGTANPLVTNAGKGTASTTVTPFSADTARGVPVIVTAGDVQSSILVKCSGVAGAAVAPPPAGDGAAPGGGTAPATGGQTGTITGPDTGSAGLQATGGALSWWPALALAAAATALLGVRFAFKRTD